MFRFTSSVLILFSLLALVSCQHNNDFKGKKQLTVSILPQKFLVASIAGDNYAVQVMLPKGSNHETYEPAPRDMEKISSALIYFTLGALDFELTWMERFKAANAGMQVVNSGEGIVLLKGHLHEHGEAEHSEENQGIDPHIWLSPACMKIQAFNIFKALVENDNADSSRFNANLEKFNHLADSVDRIIREILAGKEGKTVLIFHPTFGYFARDYNLNQISIEQDGKEPSPAYLGELIKIARAKGIKSVFISKEFDTRNAEAIAREIDGKIVVFDPMAENWAENMIMLARLIAEN